MMRRGFLNLPPEEDEPHPLFNPDSARIVQQIEQSDLWRYLKDGMAASREALFASKPISTEDLWRTWGAIEALTTLLHGGPMTVLQYSLLAAKAEATQEPEEREYKPAVHKFDG
jgi:hypothetical protein